MVGLEGLVDVAPMGQASQSSVSKWSRPDDAQGLITPHDRDYGNHTDIEESPWWKLDLPNVFPLYRIVICNRSNFRYQERASRIIVEISINGKVWETVHTGISYFGDGLSGPSMKIELGGKVIARHIRLSLPEKNALNLKRVHIFVLKEDEILLNIWKKYGFSFPERAIHPKRGAGGPYKIVSVGTVTDENLTGLKVVQYGRWGNNIIQVTNAIFLAKYIGVDTIWVENICFGKKSEVIEVDGVKIIFDEKHLPDGLYLRGDFYFKGVFGGGLFEELDNGERYTLAQKAIFPLMVDQEAEGEGGRGRELAIHIRSGDVFSDRPHPGYVQPPLCFYVSIVDELRAHGEIDRVCIVSEDRKNPCVNALEIHLSSLNVSVKIQSGTLYEDISYLRGASHLVLGTGTFGLGICLLSKEIKSLNVFSLGRASEFWNLYVGLPNVLKYSEYSVEGDAYIRPGEWKNTPEQRRLMLELPASCLTVCTETVIG